MAQTDPAWLDSRNRAEKEAEKDLKKPWRQLLADVHHEILYPDRPVEERIAQANKRMVSLMARAAIAQEKSSQVLLLLTGVLLMFTVVIAVLTWMLWRKAAL